jgi:hypothetical protein
LAVLLDFAEVRTSLVDAMPTSVSEFLPSAADTVLIAGEFQLELACSSVLAWD